MNLWLPKHLRDCGPVMGRRKFITGAAALAAYARAKASPNQQVWLGIKAGGFNPSTYGTVEWWYKADAISGLANSDPVTQWDDSSGNSRHLTSASGKQPLYKTNQQNSLPGVLFDGTDDYLRYNTGFTQSYASSFFGVVSQTTQGSKVFFIEGGTNFNDGVFYVYGDNVSPWAFNNLSYYCTGVDNWLTAAWDIIDVHYDGSAAPTYYLNGTAQANNTLVGSAGTGTQSNVLNVGARNAGTALQYQGYIGEVFRYNAKLSSSDITTVRAAMSTKWNIAVA